MPAPMRFSVFSVNDHHPDLGRSIPQLYQQVMRQCELGEALGYDTFFCAEHHFHQYGVVPDPARITDAAKAAHVADAIAYMGLKAGQPLVSIAVDRVFIGSCTNSRIEDLRAAAAVLTGRRAKVPGLVSPGSSQIKAQAEQEGLDRVFVAAGLEWAASGCSMCVGMNGDLVASGERCASTTNRNFKGRQGAGARTHLMSPAMVAAAAVAGTLTDVRPMLIGRV